MIGRVQDNFLLLMKRNLLFWTPVQLLQFGYIQEDFQEDFQISFLSTCGLAWMFILSKSSGAAKSCTPEREMGTNIVNSQGDIYEEEPASSSVPGYIQHTR
jgi:hypothetical protein